MKFCYNTNSTLPKQCQKSRSILHDGSRTFGLFWKEKPLSYNRRNTVLTSIIVFQLRLVLILEGYSFTLTLNKWIQTVQWQDDFSRSEETVFTIELQTNMSCRAPPLIVAVSTYLIQQKVNELGDNCNQNCHLWRKIFRFMVENFVLLLQQSSKNTICDNKTNDLPSQMTISNSVILILMYFYIVSSFQSVLLCTTGA